MSLPKALSKKAYSVYESKLRKEVMESPIPRHVAIIMDGNRRYAKERGETVEEGHRLGKEKLEEVLDWCIDTGVKVLTVYAFSTENFKRDQDEVDHIMNLLKASLREMADSPKVRDNGVRIRAMGDMDMLPDDVVEAVRYSEEKTAGFSDHYFNMAIAYGGRQEIVHAVKNVVRRVLDGELEADDIDEEVLSFHMYASDMPDPDLVLRTSGEIRISNFLLWQTAYSELYFTDVYWPGFRYIDFLRAIRTYQQRSRRYGE